MLRTTYPGGRTRAPPSGQIASPFALAEDLGVPA